MFFGVWRYFVGGFGESEVSIILISAIRSQRREIDHVLDKVNDELLQEEKVVAEAKRILAVVSTVNSYP